MCNRGLRAELQRLHGVYSIKLVTSLQSSLERRLAQYEGQELFQLATTFDPRFKLDWCDERQGAEVKGSSLASSLRRHLQLLMHHPVMQQTCHLTNTATC